MINDLFIAGALSGIIANIPANILDYILYRTGINNVFVWHICASVFLEKKDINTSEIPAKISELFIGAMADYTMAGIKGVFIAYLLYFTGIEFYIFKGIAIGLFFWLFCFGVLMVNTARINPVEPGTNLTHLFWHILLGGLASSLIVVIASAF